MVTYFTRKRSAAGGLLALAICLAVGPSAQCAEALPTRPNIVLILADDLGYGDLGCYNVQSKIPTPRIDRLAAEGLRFSDAHTPCSVCTPTRYGLLTGRYCWRTRLTAGVLNGYSPALIEPGRLTLASLLKGAGYRTACIGKWHLGLGTADPADYSRPFDSGPNSVGFDESFVLPASLDMPPYVFVQNQRATVAPSEQIGDSEMRRNGGNGFWRAGAIAPGFTHANTLPALEEQSLKFIRRQTRDKPFFLYFPLTAPHTPWMPTDRFRHRGQAGYYGDFVAQVDATVGAVLDSLGERELADNTLVVFTSDNGAHWLPTDIEAWHHRSNAHWRGQKGDIWEGGHRVPLIVRWPGVVAPGTRSVQLVCLTDVVATTAAIVGQKLPADAAEDSLSFLPVLLPKESTAAAHATPAPLRDAIVHHAADGTLGIRQGAWKLVPKLGSHGFSAPKTVDPQPGGPTGQLYQLDDDPAESHNRWLDHPEMVARLTQLLSSYQTTDRSRPGD